MKNRRPSSEALLRSGRRRIRGLDWRTGVRRRGTAWGMSRVRGARGARVWPAIAIRSMFNSWADRIESLKMSGIERNGKRQSNFCEFPDIPELRMLLNCRRASIDSACFGAQVELTIGTDTVRRSSLQFREPKHRRDGARLHFHNERHLFLK
jgi:hypothetical protein